MGERFVRDDELFILMDIPNYKGEMMTPGELGMLRDAGVRTVYWNAPAWDDWAERDFKRVNWERFDDYVERLEKADLKALVLCWPTASKRYPGEYYVKYRGQHREFGVFSPWNAEAMAVYNRSLELVRDHLPEERCQVISGFTQGGERVLMNHEAYFDDYATADWQKEHEGYPDHTTEEGARWLRDTYRRVLLQQKKVLMQTSWREVWYQLSRYKEQAKHLTCHGCEWVEDYLADWKKLKPRSINHIQFNYFPYGERLYGVMAEEVRRGVSVFVGAEYCEGLRAGNGRTAMEQGLRMILGPLHPYTKHRNVEGWMVEQIRAHQEIYERGRRERNEV